MIAAGKLDTEVAYALGHKDAQITRIVYAHWFRNKKSDGALAKTILPAVEPSVSEHGDILETAGSESATLH
jgi:hypothetical protein